MMLGIGSEKKWNGKIIK